MILALGLHIVGLLVWAAGLLYLPALIRGEASRPGRLPDPPAYHRSLSHWFFTIVLTPAALFAIIAGTAVFTLDHSLANWLLLKLVLVTVLVVCHCLLGGTIMLLERGRRDAAARAAMVLLVCCAALMVAITVLVLVKPEL